MKTISIYNVKGGTAKTTSSIHIAGGIKVLNPAARVLLIDMDGQYSLKTYFRLKLEKRDSFDFIFGAALDDCIYPIEFEIEGRSLQIDIMPSSARMSAFEEKALSIPGKENLLSIRLEEAGIADRYDYFVIDCPPALSQNTINALMASDYLIAPANMDDYCFTAVSFLNGNLQTLQRNLRKAPIFLGVLPTMFDARQTVNASILSELPKVFSDLHVFPPIRTNSGFRRAQVYRTMIFENEKQPRKGTEEYLSVCREILNLIAKPKKREKRLADAQI